MQAIKERVIGDQLHKIRTSNDPAYVKKAMFELSFYLRLTQATRIQDFTPACWGNTLFHLISKGYDARDTSPKVTVNW